MDLYLLYRKAVNKYIHLLFNPVNKIYFKLNKVRYGKHLKTRGKIYIMRHYASAKIIIGNNVSINSAAWANPIGCGNKTFIQMQDGAELIIGDRCGLSNVAITCANRIELKNNVMIGSGCRIYDTDFHDLDYSKRVQPDTHAAGNNSSPIVIDEGVFIGAGSYILKGVHIGEHSIIGAASVVAKNIPANQVWAGNPARFIKKIEVSNKDTSAGDNIE